MRTIPGGDYRAEQNADGTWNVLDVPTYPVHERKLPTGYRDNEVQYKIFKIDAAWLSKTLSYHKFKRDEESFLYPLHINHHEYCGGSQGQEVLGAGFHMPRRIGKVQLDGKQLDCMFEDFIGLPPEVFALMEKGQLPYCSAEILNLNENVISSVSLMQHDVPYFPLPLITIGKKTLHPQASGQIATASFAKAMTTAAAYSRTYDGGTAMPKTPGATDDKDTDKTKDDATKPAAGAVPKVEASGTDSKLDQLIAMLTKLLGGAAATPAPDAGGVIAPAAAAAKHAAEAGASAGQIDALRARLDKRDREDAVKIKCKTWALELAPYNLGVDVEAQLFAMAVDPQKGEPAAAAYVEAVKKNVAPMPPSSIPSMGTITSSAAVSTFPKEVLAYQKDGAEALNRAHAAYKGYEEAKAHGLVGPEDTLESWIKNQMRDVFSTPRA